MPEHREGGRPHGPGGGDQRGNRGGNRDRGGGGQRRGDGGGGAMDPRVRSLPLYGNQGLGFFARDAEKGFADGHGDVTQAHIGLVFDKFADTWRIDTNGRCEIQEPAKKQDQEHILTFGSKRAWLEETIKHYDSANTTLKGGLIRVLVRERMIEAIGGQCFVMKTDWRFVSGLGNGHPFETGFIWHRTLGVPYLSGSSVKGLLRAWADPRLDKEDKPQGWGDPNRWPQVKHLFGDTNDDGAGTLIVFDALPLSPPTIELDIMNPHYAAYYAGDAKKDPIPPADYLSPTPIFFLAVAAGQSFQFVLAPRCPKKANAENDVALGFELLKEALSTLGAGGKTAVGYGTFHPEENKSQSA